jgi:hypothetical protein
MIKKMYGVFYKKNKNVISCFTTKEKAKLNAANWDKIKPIFITDKNPFEKAIKAKNNFKCGKCKPPFDCDNCKEDVGEYLCVMTNVLEEYIKNWKVENDL